MLNNNSNDNKKRSDTFLTKSSNRWMISFASHMTVVFSNLLCVYVRGYFEIMDVNFLVVK